MIILREKKFDYPYDNSSYYGGYYPQATQQEQQPKERHTGRNIALGTVAAAGLFQGARKGLMGNTARLHVNDWYTKAGSFLGNTSMMKSGALDRTIAKMKLDGMSDDLIKQHVKNYKELQKLKNLHLTASEADAKNLARRNELNKAVKHSSFNEEMSDYLKNTGAVGQEGVSMMDQIRGTRVRKKGDSGRSDRVLSNGKTADQIKHEQAQNLGEDRAALMNARNEQVVASTNKKFYQDQAAEDLKNLQLGNGVTQDYHPTYNVVRE